MGTNLSGFPVKESCLLLGTPGEGPGSQGSSTRVAAVKSPRSRPLSFHQAHIPSPGMSLIFHPELPAVGDKAVSRGRGVWPRPPTPSHDCHRRSLTNEPCHLCRRRVHNRGLMLPRSCLPFWTGALGRPGRGAGWERGGQARPGAPCCPRPRPACQELGAPLQPETPPPKVCHGP